MIRGIVAIDSKNGMANEQGIPWKIPGDERYFVDKLRTGLVLMGYGTYIEVKQPFHGHTNYVATGRPEKLRDGFVPVSNVQDFLQTAGDDVWNIGGPGLLATTMNLLDELYITQLEGDFHCTKFLPEFRNRFVLSSESAPHTENGITYRFQIWKRQ